MKVLLLCVTLPFPFISLGQEQPPKLSITNLAGDYYVYTTYKILDGKPYPSNSMYLVTDAGVVMVDTPWDTTQFQPLMDSIAKRHDKRVTMCIVTHHHGDRAGGLTFLRQRGVVTYSSKQTYDLCRKEKSGQAEHYFRQDTTFAIGGYSFQTYYPGEGHSKDNIVLWFSQERILYAGCLVKSGEIDDLGYIADVNLSAWNAAVRNVVKKFRNARFVIPGHFGWKGNEALDHSLYLLRQKLKG